MTRRENLLRLLRGETPGWVPCSINFAQWFRHHARNESLPAEIADCEQVVDAMRVLGMDIFSRNLDGGIRQVRDGVEIDVHEEPGRDGPRSTSTLHTPHGDLVSIAEAQQSQSTSYQVKDLITDWPAERDALFWILERTRFDWDGTVFETIDRRIGDAGLPMVPAGCTPLKFLHNTFGLDGSCLFVLDEPDDARRIGELYWSKLFPVLKTLAAQQDVHAVILQDNVDTPFYPPAIAERLWTPYVREAAALMEANGTVLFVHACGQLRGLIDQFRAAEVHGLEGMAHSPLGDFPPSMASQVHDRFIYNGGFSAHEQMTRTDDELEPFYRQFFDDLGGYPRFIFGAACQTSVGTSWNRIRRVVDLCRRFGGAPPD